MMKITGLSHLFKWENLHNWWLTKYFFAPLYVCVFCILSSVYVSKYVLSICKLFLHCLEHALKNFTHQGTCAVVM